MSDVMITELPTNEPLVQVDRLLARSWLQTLGDMNEALKGEWGLIDQTAFSTDIPNSGFTVNGRQLGNLIILNIDIISPTSTGSITWNKRNIPFNASPSILSTWEYSGSSWSIGSGSYVEDKTISVTNSPVSRLMLTGSIIRK